MNANEISSFILSNKDIFNRLIDESLCETDEEKRLSKLADAASFAVHNVCGYATSARIENEIIQIACNHSVDVKSEFKPDSTLHVMTEAYHTGGHTRVVEGWIKGAPSHQVHSVVLTKKAKMENLPQALVTNVSEKKSEIIVLKETKSAIHKALELRQLASGYEHIILHVHMNDIVPLLAFGSSEFKRPVMLFNHADHLFWVGASIADLVVNLREYSSVFNDKNRQCHKNDVLPLPIPSKKSAIHVEALSSEDAEAIKQSLGFAKDSKVVVTMASSFKYVPFLDYNFIETAKEILKQSPNSVFLVIGPSPNEPDWKAAYEETRGRIKAIGIVDNLSVQKYLKIASIGFDSFPISSFVSLLEIARYNVPCLALITPLNDFDIFRDSGICCNSQEELVKKASDYLNGNSSLDNKMIQLLEENHFEQGFGRKLQELYSRFPSSHSVSRLEADDDRQVTDLEEFVAASHLAQSSINKYSKHLVKVPYLLEIYKKRDQRFKRTCLKLFNMEFDLIKRKAY